MLRRLSDSRSIWQNRPHNADRQDPPRETDLKRILAAWLLLTTLFVALSHVGTYTGQDASSMPGVCCSQAMQDHPETEPLLPDEAPTAALMPAPRVIPAHLPELHANPLYPPLFRPPRA